MRKKSWEMRLGMRLFDVLLSHSKQSKKMEWKTYSSTDLYMSIVAIKEGLLFFPPCPLYTPRFTVHIHVGTGGSHGAAVHHSLTVCLPPLLSRENMISIKDYAFI